MDKKYQIFISSTYEDLKEARQKVRDAILSMYHFPVGMEFFGAAAADQWEIIKETIDSSDYYVLIIAHRYGTVITDGEDAGIGYTEKEFQYAKKTGIPILVFLMDETVPIAPQKYDTDPELLGKLQNFKTDAKNGRTVEWWKNIDELAQKVTASLYNEFVRKKRPGWVRSDKFDMEKSHAELLRLMDRVRELEDENARLKSQVAERKPTLNLRFEIDQVPDKFEADDKDESMEAECYSHENLLLENSESGLKFQYVPVNMDEYRHQFSPLTKINVFPWLQSFVSEEALQEYNDALPDNVEVEQYIQEMEKYQHIHTGGIALSVKVNNVGTCVANDVRVRLDFPDEFLIFEVPEAADVKMPDMPDMPPNPIEKAEKEYARCINPIGDFVTQMGLTRPVYGGLNNLGFLGSLKCSGINEICTESMYVDEHAIELKSKQIQHYDLSWFCGVYVVPMAKGRYQIRCSIMCSEYLEPDIKYIDVEVV